LDLFKEALVEVTKINLKDVTIRTSNIDDAIIKILDEYGIDYTNRDEIIDIAIHVTKRKRNLSR